MSRPMNTEQRARDKELLRFLIAYTIPHPIREFVISRLVDRGWLTDEHDKPCELTDEGKAMVERALSQPASAGEGQTVPLRAVLNFINCIAIDNRGLRHEYVESRSGSLVRIPDFHAYSTPTPPAAAQEDGREGRYFCDGPTGHFYMNDLRLARSALKFIDHEGDDWTITDLHDAAMLTSPDSGKEG